MGRGGGGCGTRMILNFGGVWHKNDLDVKYTPLIISSQKAKIPRTASFNVKKKGGAVGLTVEQTKITKNESFRTFLISINFSLDGSKIFNTDFILFYLCCLCFLLSVKLFAFLLNNFYLG